MRRIHIKHAAYHLTYITQDRYPYFEEDIFCNLFLDQLEWVAQKKFMVVVAFKINPDHVHLVVQLNSKFTCSDVSRSLKRSTSIRINELIAYFSVEPRQRFLTHAIPEIYYTMFRRKHGGVLYHPYRLFYWRRGFHDNLIKSRKQFENTLEYLRLQSRHHGYDDNVYLKLDYSAIGKIQFVR